MVGNNFGVEVQQHVLDKISNSYRACQRLHSVPRTHYRDRMELGRTWNRFPNLKDHAVSINTAVKSVAQTTYRPLIEKARNRYV